MKGGGWFLGKSEKCFLDEEHGSTGCLNKKLKCFNSLPIKNCYTFSGNFQKTICMAESLFICLSTVTLFVIIASQKHAQSDFIRCNLPNTKI